MSKRTEVGLDNFRFFYVTLPGTYELPGVSAAGITPEQKAELYSTLERVQPAFLRDFYILPENRPARLASELHLARALEWEGRPFVFVIRILGEYRGGAEGDEIIKVPGDNPRIRTRKIYYRARIVPCSEVETRGGRVVDFVPERLQSVGKIYTETRDDKDVQRGFDYNFAMFQETDMDEFNAQATARLGDWSHGSVFYPLVGDDYVTLSLNLPYPHPYCGEVLLPYFARAFAAIKEGTEQPAGDREFWARYFDGMRLERSYSRAGNPHWRFTRMPWEDPA